MILNIFLLIAVFCNLFLGLLVLFKSDQNTIKKSFAGVSFSLVFWGFVFVLISNSPTNQDITYLFSILFIGPIFLAYYSVKFSTFFPDEPNKKFNYYYLIPAILFLGCLPFGSIVSSAIKNTYGQYVIIRGWCYPAFGIYFIGYIFLTLNNLYKKFKKSIGSEKEKIKLFFLGAFLLSIFATTFDLILPMLKINSLNILGPISTIFLIGFTAYAILKHELMDISVIIKRSVSILITLIFSSATVAIALYYIKPLNYIYQLLIMTPIISFWIMFGHKIQEGLITSAKKAFVKGWFDSEKMFKDLSNKLSGETNRLKIFKTIESVFDEHINFERTAIIVANRSDENKLIGYQLIKKDDPNPITINLKSPLIKEFVLSSSVKRFSDLYKDGQAQLTELHISSKSLFLPLNSPEILEGVIVLDERSCEVAFKQSELDIFNTIINYISAILYKLTPYEKIEKNFLANQKRLHDAEVQILRSKKNESISHMHRQFAHELRTPLNCIYHLTDSLETKTENDPIKKEIYEEIDNALAIVKETLLSLPTNNDMPERIEQMVSVNDAIIGCLKILPANGYTVEKEFSEIPKTLGVYRDIQIVFTNLMSNARDAMPKGGTVTITTYHRGSDIYIKFSDTGKGIPDDMKDKVWQPYISGNHSEFGNDTGGRGWGLTIVNRIIEEHQGFISFESELGKGTTFTIRLPIRSV